MPAKNNNSDGDRNGMNVAKIMSSPNKSSAASKRKARRRTRLMEMSKKLTTKDLTKMKKSDWNLIVKITSFLNDRSVFESRDDWISSFKNSRNDKQHLPALLELLCIVDAFEPYQIETSKLMLNMSIENQGEISRDAYTAAIERIQSIGSIVDVLCSDKELVNLYNKASKVHSLQLEQARLSATVQMHESDNKAGVDKTRIESDNKAGVDKTRINAAVQVRESDNKVQVHESDNKAGVDKTRINAAVQVRESDNKVQVHESDNKAGVDKTKINAVVQVHESDNKADVDKTKINAVVQVRESDNKAGVDKTKINANAAVQMNRSDNKAGVAKAKIDANTASNNTARTNTMMTLKVILAKLSKGVVSDKSNIEENSMTVANANRRGLPHRPKRGCENDLCKSCNLATLINDWSQGDRVCTNCGVVDLAHLMMH